MLGVFGRKHIGEGSQGRSRKPAANEVQFYDLPEILVNLNTGAKTETYLEATGGDRDSEVGAESPRSSRHCRAFSIAFRFFLRELRLEDLNGSAGTYRLKQELLRRVRLSGLAVPVNDVLIHEMIIQ